MTLPIICVTGITGKQGGAVADALLERAKDKYAIRGVTRNVNSEAALKYSKQNVELVKGDLNDVESMKAAFSGCYGAFVVTNYFDKGVGYEGEMRQGKLCVDAAKAAGVKHFIYTSVPRGEKSHTGVEHFDSKYAVEDYLKSQDIPYTILRPVAFYDNFCAEYTHLKKGEVGWPTGAKVQQIAVKDIGVFGAIAFLNPSEYLGKAVGIAGELIGPEEIEKAFTNYFGYQFKFQVTPPRFLLRLFSKEMALMFDYMENVGFNADIPALKKVHPGLMTFEEWLKQSDLNKRELAEPSMCSIQ